MSFPRYPAYKPSGVEWLGEVPEHWDVLQSRRMFKARREAAKEGAIMLTASQKYGMIPQAEFVEREGRRVVEVIQGKDNLIQVEPDDFVISMRSFQGGLEWCRFSGSTSFHYVPVTPIKHVMPCFFAHLLKSDKYISALRSTTNLIRDGQEIRYSNFVQVPLPIIPVSEQIAIATFLDHETAKIDALIAEQQRLIELLQEKRQAVISHAVTKGLNPDAPMKDSGVEWLGEVPEHWSVSTIKRIVSTPVTDGPHETPEFLDEGIPFVSAEAVSTGKIDFERIRGFISLEDHQRYSQKYNPKRDDIFMIKSGATTGTSAIVETDIEFNIWSPLAVIRCGSEVLHRFALHFIRSRNFLEAVALGWSFGTQQNIGMGVIENLSIVVPSLEEQREIVFLLDSAAGEANSLILEAERSIALLQERRSALISAAVTGQIDVRGLVPEAEAA